jgi:membrane protein
MLAVVVSVTSSFLKKQGEDRIDQFIVRFVATMTPPASLETNAPIITTTNAAVTNAKELGGATATSTNLANRLTNAVANSTANTNATASTNSAAGQNDKLAADRRAIARHINEYIQNTRSGALGITGSIILIFAGISLLARIETTFNDIWGVAKGRSWFMRIVLYWGVLSLAPLLLIVALGLATGPHLESTKELIHRMPVFGNLIYEVSFQVLPVVILCLTFALLYMLMPNTRVHWEAALVGGLFGGLLFHLNNLVSVLYVSRVVSNSRIYGSLGLVPVFMIGLYFSWLILLFGAQVAYAFQNRNTYLEEKQVENVNQRGREFVALRLMTAISQRFHLAQTPPTIVEMSQELSIPSRLAQQVLATLIAARLVVESAGDEAAFLPGRPLETITCHDVLQAMRAGQGQELSTKDEPLRHELYGEFLRIEEAERTAAGSVSMLALAARATKQIAQ